VPSHAEKEARLKLLHSFTLSGVQYSALTFTLAFSCINL